MLRDKNILNRESLLHVASLGGCGGATAGALISFGSCRTSVQRIYVLIDLLILPAAFELVKV